MSMRKKTEVTRAKASGANIKEAQRNTVAVKLRLPPAIVEQLDALVAQLGSPTRSEFVAALIDSETNRAARRK